MDAPSGSDPAGKTVLGPGSRPAPAEPPPGSPAPDRPADAPSSPADSAPTLVHAPAPLSPSPPATVIHSPAASGGAADSAGTVIPAAAAQAADSGATVLHPPAASTSPTGAGPITIVPDPLATVRDAHFAPPTGDDSVPTLLSAAAASGATAPAHATHSDGALPDGAFPEGGTVLDSGFAPVRDFAAVPTRAEGPVRMLGPYIIEGRLGEGGMGVVYHGVDTRLGRPVAIKFMRDGQHASADDRARFLREPRATASLRHPGIVQIYDTGEQDGAPWFAMEFLEGRTLGALLTQGCPPSRETAALLRRTAEALQFAHENGVIHRDLKPENIMIVGGQPKVMDFGLAKSMSEISNTVAGTVMGTPHYMPPEQAAGNLALIDARSDVYSLGVVLFQCLTGRLPFEHADPYEVLARIRTEEAPLPHRLRADVPRDLEKVCLKAMAKERGRRYPSARELALDLGRYLDGLPVLAVPPSALYRLRKLAGRHRRVLAAVALSVAAMSVVVGWQLLRGIEARAHQARARELRDAAERALPALVRDAPNGDRFRAGTNAIEAALALAPDDAELRLWRARARDRAGNLDAALADVDRVLATQPRHARARLMKAWLHYRRQRPGDWDRTRAALDGWEECAPEPDLAAAGPLLRSLLDQDTKESFELAQKTVAHWPAFPEFQAVVTAVLRSAALPKEARGMARWLLPLLDEHLAIAADDSQALGIRVSACLALDDEEEAVATLQRTLAVNPREWPATNELVGWLRHSGRLDEAERWLETARTAGMPEPKWAAERMRIALARGDAARASELGFAALRAAGRDLGEAIEACKAIEHLNPKGEDLETVRAFLRALPTPPAGSMQAFDLASRFLQFGMPAEAQGLIDLSAAAGASAAEVHRARARLFAEQKQRDAAIAEWTALIALEPANPNGYAERARLRLYDILKKPGSVKQIVADLTRAIDRGHTDEDLLLLRAALRFLAQKRGDAVEDVAEYALRHSTFDFARDGIGLDASQAKAYPWLTQNVQALSPEVAAELVRRGDAAAQALDWKFAQRCYSHAHRVVPDHPPALAGLASCAVRTDPLAAILYLEKAVAHGAEAAALRDDPRFALLRPFPGFQALGK